MNVLSLFDGISCGQVALNRAGISYDNYFASEIDKHAIKVTQHNFPNTIQLGDVCKIDLDSLPKIDLLIGGSPCQGFSIAGKMLNFDDPRSKLFFEYVRVLENLRFKNPRIKFLLENVPMKKEWQLIISDLLGVTPIKINSALVSAQNRNRLYWTNITGIQQPEDRGIILRDILENGFVERQKDFCLDANYAKGGNLEQYFIKKRRQLVFQVNPSKESGGKQPYMQNRIYHESGKSPTLTASKTNSINDIYAVDQSCYLTEKEILRAIEVYKSKIFPSGKRRGNMKFPDNIDKKSRCVIGTVINGARETIHVMDGIGIRKLTPLECERLQTLNDGYTANASNHQRYKMIGNGWTVDVIAHIFKFL